MGFAFCVTQWVLLSNFRFDKAFPGIHRVFPHHHHPPPPASLITEHTHRDRRFYEKEEEKRRERIGGLCL